MLCVHVLCVPSADLVNTYQIHYNSVLVLNRCKILQICNRFVLGIYLYPIPLHYYAINRQVLLLFIPYLEPF